MKISMKAKPEAQQQLKLRVPASLEQQIDATRKLADERGIDYNATVVEALARFNSDLHAQLTKSGAQTGPNHGANFGPDNGSADGPITEPRLNGRKSALSESSSGQ